MISNPDRFENWNNLFMKRAGPSNDFNMAYLERVNNVNYGRRRTNKN
jgi:hypothetical protein